MQFLKTRVYIFFQIRLLGKTLDNHPLLAPLQISYRGIYQSVTSRNLFSVIHFLLQQNFCCVTHHTKIVFYCITAHRTTKRKETENCLIFFLFFYTYLSLKKSLTCSFRRNREIFIMTLQKNSQQLNSLVNMFRI